MTLKIVSTSQLIDKVIPHFDKYPLLTQKRLDFELFKKAVNIINKKEHLTDKGLQEIFNLKSGMNKPHELRNPSDSLAVKNLNLA